MSGEKYPASTGQEVQGSLARALFEKGGPSVLPLIASIFSRFGTVQGKKMKQKLECNDFNSAVKAFFGPALESKPPRAEVVQLTEDRLLIKAFTCRMGIQGVGMGLCKAIMELDKAMISEMCGEKVDMYIEKSLANNDECCLIEFKTRERKE